MSENRMQNLMADTIDRIRKMVDVDTAVGTPIYAPDGTMVVPISRIAMGLGSGGSDFTSKTDKPGFGAGVGAGVTVTPVCFLVVSPKDGTRVIGINAQAQTTADRLVELLPDAVSKVSDIVSGFTSKKDADVATETAEPETGTPV